MKPSAIREILKATSDPEMIPFAAGNPDADAFPIAEIRAVTADILARSPIEALQYGVTEGYAPLREKLAAQMETRMHSMRKGSDDLIVTSGAQQVMDLTAKAFLNEGDAVICENPSFIGSLNCFRSYNARLCGVDIDSDGINLEQLEHALKTEKNVRLIYVIPNFQNPTGVTMSLSKRRAVYDLAKRYGVMILEDNPYGELRVSGDALPNIKSMDEDGIVIYSGSFSKIMSSGLRIGYTVANCEVIAKMVVGKQCADVHTPLLGQMIADRWLERYSYDEHIERLRGVYSRKLNLMCDLIDSEMNGFFEYVRPQGGLFVWCGLPQGVETKEFVLRAVEKKVAVVPGEAFMTAPVEKYPYVRLNFSTPDDESIITGIRRLAQVGGELRR